MLRQPCLPANVPCLSLFAVSLPVCLQPDIIWLPGSWLSCCLVCRQAPAKLLLSPMCSSLTMQRGDRHSVGAACLKAVRAEPMCA